MGFIHEERPSDSPYIETITRGQTEGDGIAIRPAESHWHLVLTKFCDQRQLLVVGPLTTAGVVPYSEAAEILWIKFKLGAFMPHLPTRDFLNNETPQGHPAEASPRTVRHRFLQAAGLAHSHIRQIERARRAAALLEQVVPILDAVYELGYFDQPHLTHALKQWVGHTRTILFYGFKAIFAR